MTADAANPRPAPGRPGEADGPPRYTSRMTPMNPAARALHALLWLLGRLPLRALHAAGDALAATLRLARRGEVAVTRRNLELIAPALPGAPALWRESLRAAGRTLFETARFWTRPADANLALVREVQGAELLAAARAAGRGVIVAAPHLGNWELLNQWLATQGPIAIVYRPPRQRWLEDLLRRARGHEGVTQVRAEAAGVRQLFRTLKDGGTVGILPDQQPKRGDGEFAPFFGVEALTMTLLPRLAQKAGARVLFGWAERLPQAQGFRIRLTPAPDGIDAPDPATALRALNAAVEACVRLAPAQYQWGYKRYSIRPPGVPARY
jgi:KDO2-lipid IV(A) lauroyltransferase